LRFIIVNFPIYQPERCMCQDKPEGAMKFDAVLCPGVRP